MVLRRLLSKGAGALKGTVCHSFKNPFHLQKDSFVSNRKTIGNVQFILNYRCPNPAETNEPISVTFVYDQVRMASESPEKVLNTHCLLLKTSERWQDSLSSCFHLLFIWLLTLTDLSVTSVLCPKCHMPSLRWFWDFLLCVPSWCLVVPDQLPHHFWIWKPSLKQEYANHNSGHILRRCHAERRRITACCPVRRGPYPSRSSSPFFDTKI